MSVPENPAVADIKAREKADPRVSLSRKQCQTEGNWSQTSQIEKENRGVLHRYLAGTAVRITARSLYAHLIDLASAPAKKVRQPSMRFRRRERTPQELEALQLANQRRAEAAQGRREARTAARV